MEIHDTLAFLLGSWEVERAIYDHRGATSGTFIGVSHLFLEPSPMTDGVGGHAIYDEQGELRLGDHVGPAARHLEYRRQENGSVSLYFRDGLHFVDLDLSSGVCEGSHLCTPDTYRIKVVVRSMQCYEEQWHVAGLNKDYVARSTYSRMSGEFS